MHVAHIVWNPSPEVFSFPLPLLNRPILWYGLLFACGFFFSYKVLCVLSPKEMRPMLDRLASHLVLGGVLGARIGEILGYQSLKHYLHNPQDILKVWEGGLSSHGGAIGILFALTLFCLRYKTYNFRPLLDLLVLVAPLAGCFIRVGNFINQEILGIPSTAPWAIIFGKPLDGSLPVPRHPVQLYEAIFYASLFLFLLWLRRKRQLHPGALAGIGLTLLFSFRFLIEFLKENISLYTQDSMLNMGQYLSIPFITLGLYLYRSQKIKNTIL